METATAPRNWNLRKLGVAQGLPSLRSIQALPEVLGGLTLAALAVPEVLGYAKIAGMPVVTGLYTMLIPVVVFAVLGSSRHLVVGADSATAAMLAAGLTAFAAPESPRYVQLAGTAALLAGALLLLARLIRLGFLANFLSRTVLVGFLTGVGIQVAIGQLPEMLGVPVTGRSTLTRIADVVRGLPRISLGPVLVSLAVIVLVVGVKLVARKVPGALLAVVGAIVVGRLADLGHHGVTLLGQVPRGLPHFTAPTLVPSDLTAVLPVAASMFVVILAQSSATSRAYAAKYDETVDEDVDLVGLAGSNIAGALTGSFVVNGSPTKTQIVDGAGGRTQWAQLVTAAVVLVVLLFLTGPLVYLPLAALAAVVFLIGIDLVDVAGLRRIFQLRRIEFGVAVLTAAAVVFVGLEQGIVLALIASVADHLRHSYRPHSTVLLKSPAGHWRSTPVTPGIRTTPGLVVYRFGSSLYFANASRLVDDLTTIVHGTKPPDWLCLDGAAISDVDYSAGTVLLRAYDLLAAHGTRLVLANVIPPVRAELDRYGLTAKVGKSGYFDTPGEVLEVFEEHEHPTTPPTDPGH